MKKKLFSILPLIVLLTACGYDMRELYKGDAYNNPVFEENYYRLYSEQIDKNNPNNTLVGEPTIYNLDDNDYLRTYSELEESGLDPYVFKPSPSYPKGGFSIAAESRNNPDIIANFSNSNLKNEAHLYGYGPSYKMNRVDDIFSYGYLSKLYDGQMTCLGYYQLARVQMDECGFGVVYDKEMVNNSKYISFQFKGQLYKENTEIGLHYSNVIFKVSLYSRNGSEFKENQFVINLNNLPTNRDDYTLLTIPIEKYNFSRIAGYSISYEFINDELLDAANDKKGYQYSIMLYEVLFPNSSWR